MWKYWVHGKLRSGISVSWLPAPLNLVHYHVELFLTHFCFLSAIFSRQQCFQ